MSKIKPVKRVTSKTKTLAAKNRAKKLVETPVPLWGIKPWESPRKNERPEKNPKRVRSAAKKITPPEILPFEKNFISLQRSRLITSLFRIAREEPFLPQSGYVWERWDDSKWTIAPRDPGSDVQKHGISFPAYTLSELGILIAHYATDEQEYNITMYLDPAPKPAFTIFPKGLQSADLRWVASGSGYTVEGITSEVDAKAVVLIEALKKYVGMCRTKIFTEPDNSYILGESELDYKFYDTLRLYAVQKESRNPAFFMPPIADMNFSCEALGDFLLYIGADMPRAIYAGFGGSWHVHSLTDPSNPDSYDSEREARLAAGIYTMTLSLTSSTTNQ